MKRFLLTAVLACSSVALFAQEAPQKEEQHVCTEQCDHSADKEMKACCKAASAEGKECSHCAKKEAKMEGKACCKNAAAKGEECAKCHPKKGDKKMAAVESKKACCSEKTECAATK